MPRASPGTKQPPSLKNKLVRDPGERWSLKRMSIEEDQFVNRQLVRK
jgi:hypothetical protein